MPYEIRKLPNSNMYRVRNKITGEVKATSTTKQNAQRQVRLLNSLEEKPKNWIK